MAAETLGATLGYVEPEAPINTLADTCRGGGRDCWGDTEELKADTFVHWQADTIRQLKAKTFSDRLADVKAGILDEIRH